MTKDDENDELENRLGERNYSYLQCYSDREVIGLCTSKFCGAGDGNVEETNNDKYCPGTEAQKRNQRQMEAGRWAWGSDSCECAASLQPAEANDKAVFDEELELTKVVDEAAEVVVDEDREFE